jgi:hypothetical protein
LWSSRKPVSHLVHWSFEEDPQRAFTCPDWSALFDGALRKHPSAVSNRRAISRFAIEALSDVSASSAAQTAILARQRCKLPILIGGFLLLTVISAAVTGSYFARRSEATFRPLVFGPGYVASARFTLDGHNVIYGASWSGKPLEVFQGSTAGPGSRNLGLPPGNVSGIASNGDLALSLGRHPLFQGSALGPLLARP